MLKKSVFKSETGRIKILEFYDKILDQWPENCKKQFIKTRYGFTFVIECGDKTLPPLILLHGTGSNSAMWSADVVEYSKRYRVFAVDIIGECGKSTENRPDWNGSHYSNWMFDVFQELQISKATIISCSLGGWIALDFSIKHPEKMEKLVLIATAGITPIKISTIFWIMITSVAGNWGFKKMNKMVYGNLILDKQTQQFIQLVKSFFIPRTNVLPIFSNKQLQKINKPIFFMVAKTIVFTTHIKPQNVLKEILKLWNVKFTKTPGM